MTGQKAMFHVLLPFGVLTAVIGLITIMIMATPRPAPEFVLRACGAGYVMTNADHTVRWLRPERGNDMALAADADIHGLCDDTLANSLARR
jgi:hypothetical protein